MLDEVQKIPDWSTRVKRLWDEDSAERRELRLVVLGSAPLLLQHGLSESLAGRFELTRVPHWSFAEMRDAFGWDVDRYIFFGGYPGAAGLIDDEQRWRRYILDSLVETTISRDVLLMTRVDKPALLRRVFHLACEYSGQIVSYQKMLGQLQDAGNTTTLAHYLQLLGGVGMVTGLEKFSGELVRQRASSPKLVTYNTALLSTHQRTSFAAARADHELWGRIVESAIGAHLANLVAGSESELLYWRDRNREVDFVLRSGTDILAIEVKTTMGKTALPGVDAFLKSYPSARSILVGAQGITIESFLGMPLDALFR